MKELLHMYTLQGHPLRRMEKKRAHISMKNEFYRTGHVSRKHKDVRLLMLTSKGRVILQRRSKWKGDNPGLWDKTIGGHVTDNEGFNLTMLKECAEELGIPTTVVKRKNFEHTLQVTDLNILGVLRKLSLVRSYKSKRVQAHDKPWIEPSITQFYVGYYDGPIRFIDKEASGIEVFKKNELLDDMKKYPELYTDDLRYLIKKFDHHIQPIKKKKKHTLNY